MPALLRHPGRRRPRPHFILEAIVTRTRGSSTAEGVLSTFRSSGHRRDAPSRDSIDSLWFSSEIQDRRSSLSVMRVQGNDWMFKAKDVAWAYGPNKKWRRVIVEDDGEWDLDVNGDIVWTYRASWIREKIVYRARFSPDHGDLRHDTYETRYELEHTGLVMPDVYVSTAEVQERRLGEDHTGELDSPSRTLIDTSVDQRILEVLAAYWF